ncbi:MAG: M1 family metallopeptidase [Pyrinomonadaceae bacterium]
MSTEPGNLSSLRKVATVLVWLLSFGFCACAGKPTDVLSSPQSAPHYKLAIRLLPEAHRLEGYGTLQLPAVDVARNSIELSLSELMSDLRVAVVSPAVSAGEAKLDKTVRPYSRSGWGTITWRINPPQPFPPNEPILLRFSYAGGGEDTSFIFSLEPKASFAGGIATAWYPEFEETTSESDGRLRGLRGTGTLDFLVPAGYMVYAPGTLRSLPQEMSQGTFRFEVSEPAFFSFGAAKYTVQRQSGTIPASLYLLRPRGNVSEFLPAAERVLGALTQEFGPYPHSEFAIIEVPTRQADRAGFDGASVDGFIFVNSNFIDKGFNTAFFGHEISHQWWGSLITSKALEGRWMLSEGMAQFGSLRAVEILEGQAAAEQYRRNGYPGYITDQCALGYFTLVGKGLDHPLFNLPKEGSQARQLADSKGFIVWDMLSRTVDRSAFSRILQDFVRAHQYQRVGWDEFLSAVDTGSGKDLKWFYSQWFEQTGAPDYSLTWKQEGNTLHGTVSQPAPYFRATLEVEIQGPQRSIVKVIEITGAQTSFNWSVPFRATTVTLDPHYQVLRWTPEFRAQSPPQPKPR